MSENDDIRALDRDYPYDIRLFRARAREERRRTRHAPSERARRIHHQMAEHYEMVADLLEAKAGLAPRSLTASLKRMLERLFPH